MMTPERRAEIEKYGNEEDRKGYPQVRESLAEIDRLNKVVDQAVPIVREYTRDNPKFLSRLNGKQQDPLGAHACLAAAELERRSKA